MARHRSPRGRRAHGSPPLVALGRTVAGEIVRRVAPVPTPLRRGVAAVAVTGGALTLAGVAAAVPLQMTPGTATSLEPVSGSEQSDLARSLHVNPGLVAAAATLPAPELLSPAEPATEPAHTTDDLPLTGLAPVPSEGGAAGGPQTEQLDTAALVKAVQLAEQAGTRSPTPSATAAPPVDAAPAPEDGAAPTDPDATDAPAPARPDDADVDRPRSDDADPARPGETRPRAAEEPSRGSTDCGLDTSQLGAVRPHVRAAAKFLGCRFGEPTVLGVAGRGGASDHPAGKALDFMVDRASGNAIANCALRDQEALGVSYVIWRQRINFGEGWKPMADRGGVTANHFDHVHVSFNSSGGGRPGSC